ncbi:hypothetical protein DEU56DRAFT_728042 [Suillus clintonianus]|uniref:uncharacterized protein n=1 Tax=Suillus clintonianus TaxID=1904413 RepID=UPI001B8837DC|nr:uncharacterized protein DEU56DRAFT_728042 [Suillus clintonianus]KAG2151410.1 hypothetical protein DEU56DRAFT_728042 [Suillus clintonianus]
MSYESSVSELPSPLKDLLVNSQVDVGKTEADKAEVAQWIEKVAEGEVVKPAALPDLEIQLVPRTYIVSNYLTAADVALYGALHPVFSQLQPAQLYSTPALTRYFDHIQTRPSVVAAASALSPAFSSVSFDLASAPPIERKPDAPKKKEKAAAVAEQVESTAVVTPKEDNLPEDKPKEKKEKKEKKKDAAPADNGGKKKEKASGPAGGKAVAEDAGEPVPSMIDMRIGHIIDVKKHPEADSLYIEANLGEETGPRTVVSGLVNYIPIEEMRDKYLVCICNLKPANMRGVKSFAMVLAATSKDGKDGGVELIQPPPGSKPGERVYFEGPDYENAQPLSQMNPKKKVFETIQPGFTTLDTKEAAWVNPATKSVHRIRTKDGVCVAPNFIGASLS